MEDENCQCGALQDADDGRLNRIVRYKPAADSYATSESSRESDSSGDNNDPDAERLLVWKGIRSERKRALEVKQQRAEREHAERQKGLEASLARHTAAEEEAAQQRRILRKSHRRGEKGPI